MESEAPELVAAVDLGGTFTKLGLIAPDGTVRAETRVPTKLTARTDDDGGRGTVDWLGQEISAFAAAEADAIGVRTVGFGVVVPGIVDAAAGLVVSAANIGWSGVELAGPLQSRLGLPGSIGHDVRTGGLAEWQLGAGRGLNNLLFVPLGTGIAAAVIVDGRLLEADGYAGELGHIRVPAAGDRQCACGQTGCLEIVAGAAGVVRNFRQLSGVAESETITAEQVATDARAGDPSARGAFKIAGTALSEAFAIALTLLGPEAIVIGGGLSGAADLLVPIIEAEFDRRLSFQRRPKLITSAFGSQAGLVGAGLLGWRSVAAERQ
ncbi:MAG: ROK family protein [Microlunatus sp.]|nr:ROK family protein [Microlunatus sp.]